MSSTALLGRGMAVHTLRAAGRIRPLVSAALLLAALPRSADAVGYTLELSWNGGTTRFLVDGQPGERKGPL